MLPVWAGALSEIMNNEQKGREHHGIGEVPIYPIGGDFLNVKDNIFCQKISHAVNQKSHRKDQMLVVFQVQQLGCS
ncbi:hypothetical protein D3C73_1458400 [compost metagenome]